MSELLTYVEIDIPYCANVYGVSPCLASVGVTGEDKCFNCPETCQDPENFSATNKTLRFTENSEHVPSEHISAIPNITSIDISPQQISPGESLGKRERVSCKFKNHPHHDIGIDPYVTERSYNAWERGTFWGKINARYPTMAGYPLRVRRGSGIDLSQFETTNYIIDKASYSGSGFSIDALDVLTFVEGNKALCPRPSNGVLEFNISSSQTTLNLVPAGIGDAEYPASGEYSIGKEYGTFTRSGDVVTLTGRGTNGSQVSDHKAGDTFQLAAVLEGNAATILEKLLAYTDTPTEYYDSSRWVTEANSYAPQILMARVAEPTEVHKLINDLMLDVALDIHTDLVGKKIIMKVLRPQIPTFEITADNAISINPALDSDRRVSSVYVRFGRVNPLEKMDEGQNYVGHLLSVNDDPIRAISANSQAIRSHYSRFIPQELRQTASETAKLIIGRYSRVLRSVSTPMTAEMAPELGQVGTVTCRAFEDATGAPAPIPMQVVQVKRGGAQSQIKLVEYGVNYVPSGDGVRRISIPVDLYNVNLRELHDSRWGTFIPPGTIIRFEGDPGVVIGSESTSYYAMESGDWPETSSDVIVEVADLIIAGAGGSTGSSALNPKGKDGGGAVRLISPVSFIRCTVGGGGGGGGGSIGGSAGPIFFPGGGGAGRRIGSGNPGGTLYRGGNSSSVGGDGGNLGMRGEDGYSGPGPGYTIYGYAGGAPGNAFFGYSLATLTDTVIYGPY